jgi:hypothetical protein
VAARYQAAQAPSYQAAEPALDLGRASSPVGKRSSKKKGIFHETNPTKWNEINPSQPTKLQATSCDSYREELGAECRKSRIVFLTGDEVAWVW